MLYDIASDLQGMKSNIKYKNSSSGILKNYQESINFRKEYETPIETGFLFFDQF
jgi:hypothetical protein